MANGWKLAAELNDPGPSNTASEPPSSHSRLNRRFWLKDRKSWEGVNAMLGCEDLLGADVEPGFLKDTGIRRTIAVEGTGRAKNETEESELVDAVGGIVVEERLVEVLLKDEELSQRCAYCGGWEYTYTGDERHKKIETGKSGKVYYWCGVSISLRAILRRSRTLLTSDVQNCSRAPRPFSKYWWLDPDNLDDSVYFFYSLPGRKG
jgi:hypothetical protein